MSVDPIQLIIKQLDRIERQTEKIQEKLDEKVDYRTFNELKNRFDLIEREIEGITKAAVSPEQVNSLIGSKLEESDARLITARDRWIRWGVAAGTMATTGLLLYDRLRN
jgi:predicted  nucleic acid-binding Zn-ribbon protein